MLVAETVPPDVSFELDSLWAHLPGADPAALLERYGDRFKLLHLKDLKKGVGTSLSGATDKDNDVALGAGQINIPAILRAARKAGVQHYFIEDESSQIALQVPQTIKYLKNLED